MDTCSSCGASLNEVAQSPGVNATCPSCGASIPWSTGAGEGEGGAAKPEKVKCAGCGSKYKRKDAEPDGSTHCPLCFEYTSLDGSLVRAHDRDDGDVDDEVRVTCHKCKASFRPEGNSREQRCPFCLVVNIIEDEEDDEDDGEPKLTSCPACDGKVSTMAEACPHCGHPMRTRGGSEPDPTPPPRKKRRKKSSADKASAGSSKVAIGCGVALALIVIMVVIGASVPSRPLQPGTRGPGQYSGIEIEAWVFVQFATKDLLRSPSTADFPALADSVTFRGDGVFFLRGHVDAQNGFGATVRERFTCTIKRTAGGSWRMVSHSMVE